MIEIHQSLELFYLGATYVLITGKIISHNLAPTAGIQLVVWVTDVPPASLDPANFPGADFVAVGDAVTDDTGAFSFEIDDNDNEGFTAARLSLIGVSTTPEIVLLDGDAIPNRIIVTTDQIPIAPLPEEPGPAPDPCKFDLRGFDVESQQRFVQLVRIGNHEGNPPKVSKFSILEPTALTAEEITALKEALAGREIDFSPKNLRGPVAVAAKEIEQAKTVARVGGDAQLAATAVAQSADASVTEKDVEALLATGSAPLSPTLRMGAAQIKGRIARASFANAVQAYQQVLAAADLALPPIPARYGLDCDKPLDWDFTPTIVQSCEPYYYHVLEFVQEVVHAGYQQGPIVGTSTLLPCQEKRIATVTVRKENRDSVVEAQTLRERTSGSVSRELDVEDLHSATIREASTGSSSSSVKAIGATAGAVLGPVVLGVAGGASKASSTASQQSRRSIAGRASQSLRDSVSRAAESIRSASSTVVRTISDSESSTASTEVIKNHSPTRTLDLVTHEIYAAFDVRQRLANVTEAIAVPLRMTLFDDEKALRWRDALAPALRKPELAAGFDAVERIQNDYEGVQTPPGRFADAELRFIEGELDLEVRIQMPNSAARADIAALNSYLDTRPSRFFLSGSRFNHFLDRILATRANAATYFAESVAPRLAEELVQFIRVVGVDANGTDVELNIDPTPLTRLSNDGRMRVSFNSKIAMTGPASRADLQFLRVELVDDDGDPIEIDEYLPSGSALIVHSGRFDYLTDFSSGTLFRSRRIRDDLSTGDGALIPTPLSQRELISPVDEDIALRDRLIRELNVNLVVYHEALYDHMAYNNPSRLRMMLDRVFIQGSNGTLTARDVMGRYIGAFDGCVVFEVGPGHNLTGHLFDPVNPDDPDAPLDLTALYAGDPAQADPLRVTTPSGSTFTKTYLGCCPLREKVDHSLAVDWSDPCKGEAPALPTIDAATIGTSRNALRAASHSFADLSKFIEAIDKIPTNSALSSEVLAAISKDAFRDITGLAKNQDNAAAAFKQVLDSAASSRDAGIQVFDKLLAANADSAAQAEKIESLDKLLSRIDDEVEAGHITKDAGEALRTELFKTIIKGLASPPPKKEEEKPKTNAGTGTSTPESGSTSDGTSG